LSVINIVALIIASSLPNSQATVWLSGANALFAMVAGLMLLP
jgi:hypothetical protein